MCPTSATLDLSIQLLGEFAVTVAGKSLSKLGSHRLQALLAYLLLHRGHPQARQTIAALFWPDTSEAQAKTNLRQVLHAMRQRIPNIEQHIDLTDGTICWRTDRSFWLDVAAFEAFLAKADQSKASENGYVEMLEQAVATYKGDLFPTCYDDWLLPIRTRLAECFHKALEKLITFSEVHHDYDRAATWARQLLQHDPLREHIYIRLMQIYERMGERAMAMQVYHTCANILQRELGIPPNTAARAIYERILDQIPHKPSAPFVNGHLPLIGRHNEWITLLAIWQHIENTGLHVVFISGEAGIGKTRILDELRLWAGQHGTITMTARAYPSGNQMAYAPLIELLRTQSIHSQVRRLDAVWRRELARLLPELLAEDNHLVSPEPMSERHQVQHLYDTIGMALAQPTYGLLLLDDVHWFDKETLAWLHYFLRITQPTLQLPHLLVVGTYRPEELEDGHDANPLLIELRRASRITEIELPRMSARETEALSNAIVGRPVSAEIATLIHRSTEGNPLFIVETVRSHLPTNASLSIPIATRVRAVLSARLAQLSPNARELAGLAAAFGQSFSYEVLAAAGELSDDRIVRGLDELWRRRIIREQGINAYDFTHDRLREVSYSEMGPAGKRRAHRRLVRSLQTLYVDQLDRVSGQLAHHCEQAGQIEQAIHYLKVAATHDYQIFALDEAIRFLKHALNLVPLLKGQQNTSEIEIELQMALCSAWAAATDFLGSEVEEAYVQANELCQKIDDTANRFIALWGLHEVALYRGDYQQSLVLAKQCLEVAEKLGDIGLRGQAHHAIWGACYFLGDYHTAIDHIQRGITLYVRSEHEKLSIQYGVHDSRSCGVSLWAMALWNMGYLDQARQKVEALNATQRELTLPSNIADSAGYAALLYYLLGKPQQAQEYAEINLKINDEKRNRHNSVNGLVVLGWCKAMQGNVDEGIALIQQVLKMTHELGAPLHQSQYMVMLAEACISGKRYRQALEVLDEGIRRFLRWRDLGCAPDLWLLKGDALQALGASEEHIDLCYQMGLCFAQELKAKVSELRAALRLAKLRKTQGFSKEGHHILQSIYSWFTEGFESPDLIAARNLLEELAM